MTKWITLKCLIIFTDIYWYSKLSCILIYYIFSIHFVYFILFFDVYFSRSPFFLTSIALYNCTWTVEYSRSPHFASIASGFTFNLYPLFFPYWLLYVTPNNIFHYAHPIGPLRIFTKFISFNFYTSIGCWLVCQRFAIYFYVLYTN